MSTIAASLKKFERWSGRLNDDDSDVRREALAVVGQIAESEPTCTLVDRSLDALALHIRNKYVDLYYALDVVSRMPAELIIRSPRLLDAILEAPLTDKTDASQVSRIFLLLIESDELPRASLHLHKLILRSKSALSLAHQGGRRDFMKVVDWAEDNGVEVAGSAASKAADVKRRIKPFQAPELIPQQGEGSAPFALNHEQIREKQVESETVSGYLAQIFKPDDAENAQALEAANVSVGARVALKGLEPILFAFALRLASRTTWKRADAEALAASLGLMVDGALEHLNEAALAEWNVLFAEGDDPIELSVEAVAGLAKQAQAAPAA